MVRQGSLDSELFLLGQIELFLGLFLSDLVNMLSLLLLFAEVFLLLFKLCEFQLLDLLVDQRGEPVGFCPPALDFCFLLVFESVQGLRPHLKPLYLFADQILLDLGILLPHRLNFLKILLVFLDLLLLGLFCHHLKVFLDALALLPHLVQELVYLAFFLELQLGFPEQACLLLFHIAVLLVLFPLQIRHRFVPLHFQLHFLHSLLHGGLQLAFVLLLLLEQDILCLLIVQVA